MQVHVYTYVRRGYTYYEYSCNAAQPRPFSFDIDDLIISLGRARTSVYLFVLYTCVCTIYVHFYKFFSQALQRPESRLSFMLWLFTQRARAISANLFYTHLCWAIYDLRDIAHPFFFCTNINNEFCFVFSSKHSNKVAFS